MGARTIGLYEIERKLGEGGFGVVYIARDTRLGRRAAIKQLLPELSGNREIVERFFNEAKAAASISHPGIVEIYDVGWHTDGSAYFAMKLLEGDTVGARLRERGAFEPRIAATIGRQVALALVAAHERGIVHRDLKPDNIMLIADEAVAIGERAVVLDFGIAKLFGETTGSKTRTGMVMGTPSYMSPEQCRGAGEVDAKSDVYSLGCILFEMLSGRPPFTADGPGAVMGMHQFVEVKPLRDYRADVPEALEALVMRALAKEPAERMTMTELAAALKPIAQAAEPAGPPRTIVGHAGSLEPQVTPPEARVTPPEVRPEVRVTPPEPRGEVREPPVEPTRPVTPEVSTGPVTQPPARSRAPMIVGGAVAVSAIAAIGYVVTRDGAAPAAPAPVAESELERGASLVKKNCIACHTLDGATAIGPTLRDAWGTARVQEDGTQVVMDEAYFREAIERPNVRVLRGFPASMPAFDRFTEADFAAMITYVKSLRAGDPAAGGTRAEVEPPDALPVITTPEPSPADAAVVPDCEPLLAAGRLPEVERCAKELAAVDAAAAASLRARAHARGFENALAIGGLAMARNALPSLPVAMRPDAEKRLVAAEDRAVERLTEELRRLVAPDCVAFTDRQNRAGRVVGERVLSQVRQRVTCKVATPRPLPATTGRVVMRTSSTQILVHVNFPEGSAKPSSFAVADDVAAVLANNPELKVELEGHTSSTGGDADNLKLSTARAHAVRQYLIGKGIDGSRLTARGHGETRPIASNTDPDGRARNNRVEFRVLGD